MKSNRIPLIFMAALLACSSPQPDTTVIPTDVTRTVVEVADMAEGFYRADLSISGMSCEMMCGGAIKKALAKVEGVESTDIDFDAEKDVDHAIVTFKSDIVDDAALVAAVNAIHDGAYQVQAVVVEVPVGSSAVQASNAKGDARKSVTDDLPEIQMPSLMDILSSIIQL